MPKHISNGIVVGDHVSSLCGYEMTRAEAYDDNGPSCEVCKSEHHRIFQDMWSRHELCKRTAVALASPLFLSSRPEREALQRDVAAAGLTVAELLQFIIDQRNPNRLRKP